MKVQSIQNNYSVKNYSANSAKPAFKSKLVNAVLDETVYLPSTQKELSRFWGKLFRAIKKEPTLKIANKEYFDYLCKLQPDDLGAFFYKNNIEDKPYGYRVDIANDEDGRLLSYAKDFDGTFMEIQTDRGFRRIGLTYSDGKYRYYYYQDPDSMIDFWPRDTYGDGPQRRITTKSFPGSSTTYCDENGDSTVISNIKGFVKDFLDIFK